MREPKKSVRTWTADDEAGTEAVGAELISLLPPGTTVLLRGDLGAGKTVLVRGMCQALGVDRREVQSPSYALIHEYAGERGDMVHVDLYRLEPDEVPALGLDELLESPAWKAVEWAERLPERPPASRRVQIERSGESGRRIITLDPPVDGPVSGSGGD